MISSNQERSSSGSEPAVDSDMLDLVARFEQNFAELTRAREEAQNPVVDENLFLLFDEQPFQTPPQRSGAGALELAKFNGRPARQLGRAAVVPNDAPPVRKQDQFNIRQSMAILRTAGTEPATTAQESERETRIAAAKQPLPNSAVEPQLRGQGARGAAAPSAEIEPDDQPRPFQRWRAVALVGGALFLALGLSGAYISAHVAWGKSPALIQTTQQGGTVLRLDKNLGGR